MPNLGHGQWPPASPWMYTSSWVDTSGNEHALTVETYFDSPVNGGGTLVLQHMDYTTDLDCPWHYIIVDRPDGVRVSFQMPDGSTSGSFDAAVLAGQGLNTFNDIGAMTAGAGPN